MTNVYKTITETSSGVYKDKGSKFIALAFPVEKEESIKEIIEKTRKKYHDARHHCYAWQLGSEMNNYRANDDGEPTNSAGKPILGQIHSFELTNILIIVVRYFGGTLLGVGGLIQAYKTASKEALLSAEIVKRDVFCIYKILFTYEDMNKVMKIVKDMNLEQREQIFEINCSLIVKVKRSQKEQFEKYFYLKSQIKLEFLNEK